MLCAKPQIEVRANQGQACNLLRRKLSFAGPGRTWPDRQRVGNFVMMPGKDCSGAAMGAPALGKLANPPLAGFFGQRKNAPDRDLAEPWRPHRGAAAIFAWHHYKSEMPL